MDKSLGHDNIWQPPMVNLLYAHIWSYMIYIYICTKDHGWDLQGSACPTRKKKRGSMAYLASYRASLHLFEQSGYSWSSLTPLWPEVNKLIKLTCPVCSGRPRTKPEDSVWFRIRDLDQEQFILVHEGSHAPVWHASVHVGSCMVVVRCCATSLPNHSANHSTNPGITWQNLVEGFTFWAQNIMPTKHWNLINYTTYIHLDTPIISSNTI